MDATRSPLVPQSASPPARVPRRYRGRALAFVPALRLLACAVAILGGRLLGALRGLGVPRDERAARRAARRRREAERLAAALGDLKGAYAKLGQFAALRYDALPPEVRGAFAALRDAVPPLPFPEVRAFVEAELGRSLEQAFQTFDAEPVGAASIAQVHRALLPGGREVAVKVQYPWLRTSLPRDLALLRGLLWLLSLRRPGGRAARRRLLDEFARGLAEELDFEREARVAAEIARNLADDAAVVVPEVVASHSTGRVLTMSYFPAVPILDRKGLERIGAEPAEVLEILVRSYARQVFVDGLFHADPHPGNLFVLEQPGSRGPRVLFVDFGLSRRLDPELRREMRLAIFALLRSDREGFLAGMERLGMIAPGAAPAVRDALDRMFARLRGEGAAPLALTADRVLALKDEAKALLEGTPGLQLPNDLLLYARTLSYLFALGAELAPEVDLMKLTVPWLLRFLAEKDPAPAPA